MLALMREGHSRARTHVHIANIKKVAHKHADLSLAHMNIRTRGFRVSEIALTGIMKYNDYEIYGFFL